VNGNGTNIQETVKGDFFSFLIFSGEIPREIISIIELSKQFFSFHVIPGNPQTDNVYKEFGIKKNGYYLIRPDKYIAYRADKFDVKHLSKYLSQFLKTVNMI
jgi:hypothetical protein